MKINYLVSLFKCNIILLSFIYLTLLSPQVNSQLIRNEFIIDDSIPWIEYRNKVYDTTCVYIYQSKITHTIDIMGSHFIDTSRLSFERTEYEGETNFNFRKLQFDNSKFVLGKVDMHGYKIDASSSELSNNSILSLYNQSVSGASRLFFGYIKLYKSNIYINQVRFIDSSILSFDNAKVKQTDINIRKCDLNLAVISFQQALFSDSSLLQINNSSIKTKGVICFDGAVITSGAKIMMNDITCDDNVTVSLENCSFYDNSNLSFQNCMFLNNSNVVLSKLNLSEKSALQFDSVIIADDTLKFNGAKLYGRTTFYRTHFPEYVDFRFVQIGMNNVDLSWINPPKGKKIKIALWGSDIDKINLNTNFELWFPDELSTNEKKLLYSRLLSTCKREGNNYLYKHFRKEYLKNFR